MKKLLFLLVGICLISCKRDVIDIKDIEDYRFYKNEGIILGELPAFTRTDSCSYNVHKKILFISCRIFTKQEKELLLEGYLVRKNRSTQDTVAKSDSTGLIQSEFTFYPEDTLIAVSPTYFNSYYSLQGGKS